jgi:hypothetical protein
MPDHIPYAPRIDLWYNANSLNGTLPKRHRDKTRDQIALSEGWALHKVVADHLNQPHPDAMLHRALGVHFMSEYVAQFTFTDRVKIDVERAGDRTRVRYTTARGSITTGTVYSQDMRRSGTSVPWIEEHAVKTPDDLKVLAHLFENLDVTPHYEPFKEHQAAVGEDGLPVTAFTVAAGPVHHIQKYFFDATAFFHYYRDHRPGILYLADALAPLYEKALHVVAESPAEVIQWGSNFDEMLTLVMGAGQTASATSVPESRMRSMSPWFSPSVWQRIRIFLGPRTSLALRIQGAKCLANIGGKVSISSKFEPH